MGLNKACTLYFKGVNKYGHVFMLPIITMDLKQMDKYTSNYNNCLTMYNCLPSSLKDYIEKIISKKNIVLSDDELKRCFVLKDDNNEYDIIHRKDADVTYITSKELKEEIKSVMMDKNEFRKALICNNKKDALKLKYDFFEYLYKTFLEDKEVIKMMDTYDAEIMFPGLKGKKLIIAALATDKDNLTILLKKIGQTDAGKRSVAIKYKKLYKGTKGDAYLPNDVVVKRFNEGLNISEMKKSILTNLSEFKNKYEKEYL